MLAVRKTDLITARARKKKQKTRSVREETIFARENCLREETICARVRVDRSLVS